MNILRKLSQSFAILACLGLVTFAGGCAEKEKTGDKTKTAAKTGSKTDAKTTGGSSTKQEAGSTTDDDEIKLPSSD